MCHKMKLQVFNQTYQNHKHKILITKYGNYVGGSISFVINIDLDKKIFIKKKDEIYSTLSRCKNNNLHNCYSEQKFDDGIYYGDWKNNEFHGDGKFILKETGEVFIGEFQNGKLHGKVAMKFKNDEIFYYGQMKNGKFDGFGTRYWDNGKEYYKGNWKNGSRHGKGFYQFKDGGSIDGHFINDSLNGFAKRIWKTNEGDRVYEGNWLNDKRHGKGRFVDFNKKVLSGEWKEDKFLYCII